MRKKVNNLITFSGLDGSGKTTIIKQILLRLNTKEKVCVSYTVYFDISIYAILRKIRNRIKYDNGDNKKPVQNSIGQQNKLLKVLLIIFRNKYVKLIVIYIDAFIAWLYFLYYCYLKNKILIIDRFYYDFLIDIGLEGININKHYKYLSKIYPRPHIPIYLDINPTEAWNRKHEYNLNYLKKKKEYYDNIFKGNISSLIIYNDDIEKTIGLILSSIQIDNI